MFGLLGGGQQLVIPSIRQPWYTRSFHYVTNCEVQSQRRDEPCRPGEGGHVYRKQSTPLIVRLPPKAGWVDAVAATNGSASESGSRLREKVRGSLSLTYVGHFLLFTCCKHGNSAQGEEIDRERQDVNFLVGTQVRTFQEMLFKLKELHNHDICRARAGATRMKSTDCLKPRAKSLNCCSKRSRAFQISHPPSPGSHTTILPPSAL